MSLSISRIVGVDISVSPLALQSAGFGILNIIGTSDSIPLSERIREYNDMAGVAVDFDSTDEEYKAAAIFFSQIPRPTTLYISRRNPTTPTAATLTGAATGAAYTAFTGITTGAMDISIDGTVEHLTDLDFSAATDLDDVATILEVALEAAVTGTTCTQVDGVFTITNATAGSANTLSFVTSVGATGLAALLKLRSTDGGTLTPGVDAESITESLDAIEAVNSKWYGFAFTKEVADSSITAGGTALDCLDAAAWAETRMKVFANTSKDADTLVAGNTTNISYKLEALDYSRTFTVYGPTVVDSLGAVTATNDYAAVSMFARGATVNFDGTDTTITYKFKTAPGIAPVELSATQASNLIAVNCDYYTQFGTSLSGDAVSMLAEGVCANGRFLDEVVGIDWLQNSIQTDVLNYLYPSTTKIPQTDAGVSGIVHVLSKNLDQAVANGLAAPGYVTIDDTEVFLPKGYYISQGLVENQSQADRELRKAPPIAFIVKGAGAIHSVTITGTFVR